MVNPNPRPGAVAVENWDEAKIEQALKELKDLHIQLRQLRSTIPRMHQNLGGPVASGTILAYSNMGFHSANTLIQLNKWSPQ